MRRWAELVAATTFLTRLPVGGLATRHPPQGACLWAYPLVGLLIGSLGAAVVTLGMRMGLPQSVAAVWAVAATVLMTGALHEDGLADTADGFGGGHTVERKLAIMRDSRIGSFGAVSLVIGLALRMVPLAVTPHPGFAMLYAAILARGAILVPLLVLRSARQDGLGATSMANHHIPALMGLAVTTATCVLVPAAICGTLVAAAVFTALTYHQIRGYTGDTLGAVEQVAECAVFSILAI